MAEVTRQLQPTLAILQKLHEWQLAFWSNGSGRVPGYFQTRVKQDDERYSALKKETEQQSTVLDAVEKYITEARTVREEREQQEKRERERRRFWLLKVILPVTIAIFSLLGILVKQSAPVIKILIDDYLKAHPYAAEELQRQKRSSVSAEPALSYERNPEQSAHIPVLR